MLARRRLTVRGTVQGVGFRPWVYRHAVALELTGRVVNGRSGLVVDIEGPADALDAFARLLVAEPPPLASVTAVEVEELEPVGTAAFSIGVSVGGEGPAVAVPVDVATCDACLAELRDPADRRYRYPFVNCTACGPRYTIIEGVPYDRASTTMARFPLCGECAREYSDPADRRFHAEPVACPVCGPRVTFRSPEGSALCEGDEALEAAIAALVSGAILAVKGLGGYHLAADATDAGVVAELRRRKARDDKPFAVLVPGIEAARELVVLDEAAASALMSPRRPIVVAPRRAGAAVAPGIAGRLSEIGVMAPYTPLHHLLVEGAGRPLVLTSGNRSDEPIAHVDDDAVRRLGPLVDGLLTSDRPIHVRCDDSVVRAGRGRVTMVRRSRGYAPQPLALAVTGPPLLAVGAQLKNTVAVASGGSVVASHHIGDLDHPAADAAFRQAIGHLCSLTGVSPEVVAHDLHPEYRSTGYALALDLPTEGVQHHHAHIASCLVEHGVTTPVLGIAFDGLGLGDDGGLWGGELLVADLVSSQRVGHLRPVPLPGGDRAAREPWRMAVAWVDQVLGAAAVAAIGPDLDERWEAVRDLARRADVAMTTSAGRLFDAVAAIAGVRSVSTYEGQAAMELEAAASAWSGPAPAGWSDPTGSAAAGSATSCSAPSGSATSGSATSGSATSGSATSGSAPAPIVASPAPAPVIASPAGGGVELAQGATGLVLDPGPLLASLLALRSGGAPAAEISARFHGGLAAGVVAAAARLAGERGLDTVALSGGVFQNTRLSEAVREGLVEVGLRVLVHAVVPPNDGGISIGQAAVASARRSIG